MTDLERLFRRLVDNLIAIDPARLHRPIALGDMLSSVIPYRTTRRALEIDSAEDYDMLVLRLCAGEGGYIRPLSEDTLQVFQDQLNSPNPDLTILHDQARAELVLGTEPLAHALGPGPDEAYAPPEEETFEEPETVTPPPRPSTPTPVLRMPFTADPPTMPAPPRITAEPDTPSPPSTRSDAGGRCSFCGGRLPAGRAVNFCPHCGQNQTLVRCPECQAELELGWRHCINCGHPISDT